MTLSERGTHAQYRTVGHLFSMFSIGIGKGNFPHCLSSFFEVAGKEMAGSSGASEASFDVSFETDIGEEFGGFSARDVELVEELIQANSTEKVPTKLMSPTSKTATLTAAPTLTL